MSLGRLTDSPSANMCDGPIALLLGREPANEDIVEENPFRGNRKGLVESFVTSEEFLGNNSITLSGWEPIFPPFPL